MWWFIFSKLLSGTGIIFVRWSFDFIFATNEDGLCHSTWITFPCNIKGCVTLSLPLFLTDPSSRQTTSTRRERIQHLGHCSLGDHSFIFYSFLLDQLDLETSDWMLNSCSDICNCFLRFVRLTVQGISSLADIKVFGIHQYSRPLTYFTSFLI